MILLLRFTSVEVFPVFRVLSVGEYYVIVMHTVQIFFFFPKEGCAGHNVEMLLLHHIAIATEFWMLFVTV